MNCPKCNHEIHKDSAGVLSCISCGYRDETLENITSEDNPNLEDILNERGSTYGEFKTQAAISRELRNTLYKGIVENNNALNLTPYMEEALILICHKMARIVNGDPTYMDSWIDIGGYSKLVVDEFEKETKKC